MRPVSAEQLSVASAPTEGLFEVAWAPIALTGNGSEHDATLWQPGAHGADVLRSVHAATTEALGVLQSWLRGDGSGVLAVQTHGAVALAGEDVADLAGAAVWGLVRSAQAEHPGRVVLIDSDGSLDARAVIASGETQLVVRAGVVYAARMRPARRGSVFRAAVRGLAVGRRRRRHAGGSAGGSVPAGGTGGRPGAGRGGRGGGELPGCAGGPGHVSRRRPSWGPRVPAWWSRSVPG